MLTGKAASFRLVQFNRFQQLFLAGNDIVPAEIIFRDAVWAPAEWGEVSTGVLPVRVTVFEIARAPPRKDEKNATAHIASRRLDARRRTARSISATTKASR